MTIGSLPITMGPAAGGHSVATEFGWTPPFSMGDAIRRAAVGVPSGSYNLSAWVGKSRAALTFPASLSPFSDVLSGTAIAKVLFNPDGTYQYNDTNNTLNITANWYTPTTGAIGSSYWIKATVNSGILSVGPTTWTSLAAAQSFSLNKSTIGTLTNDVTLQISTSSSGSPVVGTCTLTETATRE